MSIPSIPLAAALLWRRQHGGEHPLFNRKHAPAPGLALKQQIAAVTTYGLQPGSYSMSIDEMAVLRHLILRRKPECVVEFGCGVSTELLLAIRAQHGFPRHIISFDQGPKYIRELRERLGGGNGEFDVHHAAVGKVKLQAQDYTFYDLETIARVLHPLRGTIDLFLVDGPSGGGGNRFLAGLVAASFAAPEALLVLHDALRDWELESATLWDALELTRNTRLYPVGRGLASAAVMPRRGPLQNGLSAGCWQLALRTGSPGDGVPLATTREAAGTLLGGGSADAVSVPVRLALAADVALDAAFADKGVPFGIAEPVNLASVDEATRARLLARDTTPRLKGGSLYRLPPAIVTAQAQILCGDALIADNIEGEWRWIGIEQAADGPRLRLAAGVDVDPAPALLIEKHGVGNYSLWWLEVLTRVFFAYRVAARRGGVAVPTRIVLRESSTLDPLTRAFHEETLRLAAGTEVQIDYLPRDTLLLTPWFASVSHFARSKTRWNRYTRRLRDRVLEACRERIAASPYAREPAARVFVLRQDSHARRIVNLEPLRAALTARGFLLVNPGELAWIDQIALFAHARVIAGVHGAGLLNLLWAAADTRVLEIFTTPTLNRNTFRHIAAQLGLPYWFYLEQDARVTPTADGSDSIAIDLDLDRFCTLLDEVAS